MKNATQKQMMPSTDLMICVYEFGVVTKNRHQIRFSIH